VEKEQPGWVARVLALPRKVLAGASAQAKKRSVELRKRYGPRYTHALASAAFFTFFLPIPGIVPVSIALVVVIAEIHRAVSLRPPG
jgi:hypothetical protein